MSLILYNTLTKRKESFKPINKKHVGIYTCGPTVYDYAHIGNLSAYIFADLLRRYLEYKGYKVKHIKNITDVGHLSEDEGLDKVEYRAIKEKKSPLDIARFYETAFLRDEKKLNIKPANKFPRATKHIKEMIALIKILLKKGFAYKTKSGVYFDIKKFKNYGQLSGNTLDKLKIGARIGVREEKRDPRDFALWIFDPKHLMQFNSPFGRGYPGWHIECSAMAQKYLGAPFDIHTGGEDNIFPHHECEIAQSEAVLSPAFRQESSRTPRESEAALNKKFVQVWMHKRHLLVNGQKMSKSLGNFYTLADLEKWGYSPLVFRFLALSAHYRTKLNFTNDSIKQAKESLEKIWEFVKKLKAQSSKRKTTSQNSKLARSVILSERSESKDLINLINKLKQNFEKAMDDDLNTPKALAAIFEFIGKINPLLTKNELNQKKAKKIYTLFIKFDKVLGLNLANPPQTKFPKEKEKEILKLISERKQARKEKNFTKADEIRKKLLQMQVEIRDTKNGTEWEVKS
ncbi:MAG: cysteine--tRNA ligase [Patescibacteria group bacterium]